MDKKKTQTLSLAKPGLSAKQKERRWRLATERWQSEAGSDGDGEQERADQRLWRALESKSVELAQDALDLGARIDAPGKIESGAEWSSPLIWAAIMGEERWCLWLANKGAEVDLRAEDEGSALHFAARFGHAICVEALLKCGAQTEAKNKQGIRAIHVAARFCSECVGPLIAGGASINALDDRMSSPLHHAALHGELESCLALINLGASLDIKNSSGQTPAELARDKKRTPYETERKDACAGAIDAMAQSRDLAARMPRALSVKKSGLAL